MDILYTTVIQYGMSLQLLLASVFPGSTLCINSQPCLQVIVACSLGLQPISSLKFQAKYVYTASGEGLAARLN